MTSRASIFGVWIVICIAVLSAVAAAILALSDSQDSQDQVRGTRTGAGTISAEPVQAPSQSVPDMRSAGDSQHVSTEDFLEKPLRLAPIMGKQGLIEFAMSINIRANIDKLNNADNYSQKPNWSTIYYIDEEINSGHWGFVVPTLQGGSDMLVDSVYFVFVNKISGMIRVEIGSVLMARSEFRFRDKKRFVARDNIWNLSDAASVIRKNEDLTLRCGGGEIVFHDSLTCHYWETCVGYTLAAFSKILNLITIKESRYEGGDSIFVDSGACRVHSLSSEYYTQEIMCNSPLFSSDGRHLLMGHGPDSYCPTAAFVARIQDRKVVDVVRLRQSDGELDEYSVDYAEWIDNETIILSGNADDRCFRVSKTGPLTLVRVPCAGVAWGGDSVRDEQIEQ